MASTAENKRIGNTATFDGKVYLHNNKIAEWRENGLYMGLAGWNTPTTRERLNGIAEYLGLKVRFSQERTMMGYLNGELINANVWTQCQRITQTRITQSIT